MRPLILAAATSVLLLTAATAPASACMSLPVNVAGESRVFMPDAPNHWTSPIGRMRARHPAYLHLGLLGKGDRWELPKAGTARGIAWKNEPKAEGGYTLWFSAQDGGQEALHLEYIFADGRRSSVLYILIIEPPPPPPGPWVLTVDKDGYRGFARTGHATILRMAVPLPAGRRWQVKESFTVDHGGKAQTPLTVEPIPDEENTFRFVPQEAKTRIILEEAGDGWLLFPDTVEVEMIVDSFIPKC